MSDPLSGFGHRMLGYGVVLVEHWTQFVAGLLTPATLFFTACTAGLIWASLDAANKTLTLYLSVAATLSGGLLGGRVERLLGQHSDERVLAARGVGDLRNLHMVANSISSLEGRLRQHLAVMRASGSSQDRVEGWFEEAVQTCTHVHGLVANAIDSWKDIIPSADLPLQINKIAALEQAVEERAAQEEQLKAKLAEADQRSNEASAMREQLALKQQELASTQSELKRAKAQLSYTPRVTLDYGYDPSSFKISTNAAKIANRILADVSGLSTGRLYTAASVASDPGPVRGSALAGDESPRS